MQSFELLTSNRFYLELKLDHAQDNIDGIFLECTGFQYSQDVIEACEVMPQNWGSANASKGRVVRTKLPGNDKMTNITLKRGMTLSLACWQWFKQVKDGKWSKQRKDASLVIYSQASDPVARINLSKAWPTSYKLADVNARSTEIEVEELEVAFEEFERVA